MTFEYLIERATNRHPSVWFAPCPKRVKVRYDDLTFCYGVGDCQQRFLIYVFHFPGIEMPGRQYTKLVLLLVFRG